MARHRSPRGAQGEDPDRTTRLRVVPAAGSSRLPTPPPALRGRATVAAVAVGAVAAAGQSLAAPLTEHATVALPAPVPVAAFLPVDASSADPGARSATMEPALAAVDAIGGAQLLTDPLALGDLDAGSEVDVANLAKAVDIGRELAREAAIIDAALSDGAAEAFLVDDLAYVKPASGRFTSSFGSRWGRLHQGIDIAGPIGTPIYALTEGVVEEAGPASGYGLWVVIRHPDGTQSLYGHVNRMFVEIGQQVEAGEQIAEIGNRGRSTGPHLHLEIWDADGSKLNPMPWLERHGIDI